MLTSLLSAMILAMKTRAPQTVMVKERQMQRERETGEVRSRPRSLSHPHRVQRAAVRVEKRRETLHVQSGTTSV